MLNLDLDFVAKSPADLLPTKVRTGVKIKKGGLAGRDQWIVGDVRDKGRGGKSVLGKGR